MIDYWVLIESVMGIIDCSPSLNGSVIVIVHAVLIDSVMGKSDWSHSLNW